jgi:hypothetical protein
MPSPPKERVCRVAIAIAAIASLVLASLRSPPAVAAALATAAAQGGAVAVAVAPARLERGAGVALLGKPRALRDAVRATHRASDDRDARDDAQDGHDGRALAAAATYPPIDQRAHAPSLEEPSAPSSWRAAFSPGRARARLMVFLI